LPDKPDHIIEIPDSLGRDVDAFREGRGEAPPMEAFMSDASLEQVERQTAQAAAAVPAESLTPISAARAAEMTRFDGETLPNLPRTRRVIPAPFQRQRISITRHGRRWMPCLAEDVRPGDTVPGVGLVTARQVVRRHESVAGASGVTVGMKVILTGKGGASVTLDAHERVQAHRLAE
jgi:hypothetical protein